MHPGVDGSNTGWAEGIDRYGNQLELYAAVHDMTIYQAAIELCSVLGRDVPWIKRWCFHLQNTEQRRGHRYLNYPNTSPARNLIHNY